MFKIILTIGSIQILAALIQFIKSKIVAVYLGPAGVGIVGTIDQFVQFAAFFSVLGFPAASIKFLSKSHSEGSEQFKKSYAGFFKFLLALSITGTILTIGFILLKPPSLGEELEKYKFYLITGLLTLPAFTLSGLFINIFAASQRSKASSSVVLFTCTASMIGGVAGVIYTGIAGLYVGNLIAGIFITFIIMIYLRAKLGLPFYNRKTNLKKELKDNPLILRTALLLYLSAITASMSYLAARYSILISFGEIEAGLLHGVMVLSFAFGTALYPAINIYLNPLVNRNVENELKIQQVLQFQRKIALLMSLVALSILMFPKLALTIMFSSQFAGVSGLVFLFIISQFIVQLAGIYQSLLIGFNDVKSYTLITSLTQLISAALFLLLVPYFGIKGVAFGFLIGNTLNLGVCLVRLVIKYNFHIPRIDIALIGYILTILFLTGLISNQFFEWSITVITLKILFLIFFCGTLLFFLTSEEKEYLKAISRKFLTINSI